MPAARTLRQRIARCAIRGATVTTLHQAIAFDALAGLPVSDASDWERVFVNHARVFALGAAAPDVDFRDFRNHLLFPNDDMWGGAAAKANCWHRNLVAALQRSEWENASYCAGVLSHYVIDALHPFHTAQTQADNDAYAALAYATYVQYDEFVLLGQTLTVRKPAGDNLSAAALVVSGAVEANRHYDELLGTIDVLQLSRRPRQGLNDACKRLMAQYLRDAAGLVAALIGSAIQAAHATLPNERDTRFGRAVASCPLNAVARLRHKRSLRNAAERAAVEFCDRGRVTDAAPAEVCVKRELYAREVLASTAKSHASNVAPLPRKATANAGGDLAGATILQFKPASNKAMPSAIFAHHRFDLEVTPLRAARIED